MKASEARELFLQNRKKETYPSLEEIYSEIKSKSMLGEVGLYKVSLSNENYDKLNEDGYIVKIESDYKHYTIWW